MNRVQTVALLSSVLSVACSAQPQYSVKKLGPLPGANGSFAHAINDAAQVAGVSASRTAEVPYRWSDGIMEPLPVTGPGTSNFALGINEGGQVVGYSSFPDAFSNAALWTKDGNGNWSVEDLGILPNFAFSRASDISDSGTLGVGDVDDAIDQLIAVAYEYDPDANPPWQVQSLGVLPDYFGSYALGLNNNGVAVGASYAFGLGHATKWTRTKNGWTIEGLALLPGGDYSIAYAVNDAGIIVGMAEGSDGLRHAAQWVGNKVVDLGVYPGEHTDAKAINNSNQVVGETWGIGLTRAFLSHDGQIVDLNDQIPPDTGWDLRSATGINDDGQIAGYGALGGFFHSYLLTPVAATLTDPVPGKLGVANSFTISPAFDTAVNLYWSDSTGETALEGCAEVPLNLDSPTLLGTIAAGDTTITIKLPEEFGGQTLYFQAVTGCSVSSVVKHTFP